MIGASSVTIDTVNALLNAITVALLGALCRR